MTNEEKDQKAAEIVDSLCKRVKDTLPELDDLQVQKVMSLCFKTTSSYLDSFLMMGLIDRLSLTMILEVTGMTQECSRIVNNEIKELEEVVNDSTDSTCND